MSRSELPDLDAEREVDLGRVAAIVAARWWLPLLGLVAGLVVGWTLSFGGAKVYRASALLYPGTPLAAGGGQLPNVIGTPATVRQLVTSEEAVRRAAAASGLRAGRIRAGISLQQQAATAATKASGAQFVSISVKGPSLRGTGRAANELARFVVRRLSPFVDSKIAALEDQFEADEAALAATARSIDATTVALRQRSLSTSDRLAFVAILSTLESRRATLKGDVLNERQLLAQARDFEKPRIMARAVPQETTARSRRNSLVVAGAIGLLLGLVAALAWDPLTRARTRLG